MSNGRGFVELGRRFRKLDPRSHAEALALDSYTTAQWGGSSLLSWDDLLKERLVVLLGEPGSGKTWEMEERVRLLNATGRCAFFIRLERLVTEPLGQVLAPVDAQRFEAWHKGTSEAIFVLDSMDETKLHRIADFGTALDKFRNAVGDRGVARASILVSSRISEWRPESDAHAVRTRVRLPPRSSRSETKTERDSLDWIGSPAARSEAQETLEPKKEDTAGDDPLVVQVVPLNRTQVQALAAATISDVQGFVAALDTYHAWEFARRPIDVTDLINYWNTHEKLGPLRVLIEHDIQCKLRETTARATVAVLSEQKAREGAEALAACVVFSRQFSFRIRDEGFVSDSPGLEPDTCLPSDWKPEEIRALLNRPILDSASYGHIRFHHRRVAEYLAAQWLQRRMRSGCPASVLHDLLFADAHTAKQVRPALAPVAAWLCIGDQPWHADVRDFSDNYETDPKTADDLFRIACRRLGDIKHYVEKAENSLREEINPTHDELALRRWFARKLTERSRDRYTAPQEEEIDQRKRLDIRLNRPGIEPVPIELKWADKWTVAELVDGLESQLVGLYLRADTAKYGIYLLANIGRKQGWQSPDCDKQMQFGEVLSLMEARANEIAAKDNHVRQIAVIGVDFRPPSTITAQVPKVQSTFALDERARVGNDAAP